MKETLLNSTYIILKFTALAEVLVVLYFAYDYMNDNLGPGWAFFSVLTLVFLAAVFIEIGGKKDVVK